MMFSLRQPLALAFVAAAVAVVVTTGAPRDDLSALPIVRVATMAAAFAEKLRQSPHARNWQWSLIRDLTAAAARNDDERELLALIDTARKLNGD